jgi:hypothetical protein
MRANRSTTKIYSGEYGRLDDLFRFDERLSPMPSAGRSPYRSLWWAITAVVAMTALVLLAARFEGYEPSPVLVLFICAGVVAIGIITRSVSERHWRRPSELVREVSGSRLIAPSGWSESDDGMLEAIRRWDRRLEWGSTSPERFAHAMAPRLRELVDGWLRQRYGLTMASDPAGARALLGEPAWAALHAPDGHMSTPEQIDQALRRLEALGSMNDDERAAGDG